MYLKNLEIQGFKSFADKVKLEFGPGITAVVGPNGSGKSNISDGIRWVLGEQSAKTLRGTKMEDIIFAGSAERKAVGMAEISLTLDNSAGLFPLPYSEVTVTRRVFRSGEGEYLINKNACRLKDVHDLFNDTGLGKESFAIIGQGRVEEVLNSRAEERRALIEEAAGIIKYRNRKREALKKLEDTGQSLDRIVDILIELSVNLEPLSAEAEKAKRYQEIKSELDALELNLAVRDLEKITGELIEVKAKLEQKRLLIFELESGYQSIESKLEKQRLILSQLDETIAGMQQNLYDLNNKLSQLESSVGISEERMKAIFQQIQRVQKDLEGYHEKQVHLHGKFQVQAEEHQQIKSVIATKQLEIAQKEKQMASYDQEVLKSENWLEGIKNEVINCLQEIANTKNTYNKVVYESTQKEQKIKRNTLHINDLEVRTADLNSKIEELGSNLKNRQATLKEHEKNRAKIQTEKKEAEQSLLKYQQSLTEFQKELHALGSRHQVLQDMQKEHEGYFQGVRSVLQAKAQDNPDCQGICGVVGEMIIVPPKYEKAIDVALGASVQNIVAKTDRDAEAAIAFLKASHGGRATFLPLNAIKVRELNEEGKKVLSLPGVIGIASELVEIEPVYQKILQHLLGNILVVKDLKSAVSLARETQYNVKMVTLEGDVINPGGSLTGGSLSKKSTGLLTRPREIKDLQMAIAKKREQFSACEKNFNNIKDEIMVLDQKLTFLEQEIQINNLKLLAEEQELRNKEQEIATAINEMDLLKFECLDLEGQLEKAKGEELVLKKCISELEAENAIRLNEANAKQEYLKTKKEESKTQIDELTACKIELASYLQKEKNYQTELSEFYTADQELKYLITTGNKELLDLENQQSDVNQALENNKKQIVEVLRAKNSLSKDLSVEVTAREKLKTDITALEQQAKDKFKNFNQEKEVFHELEINHARLDSERTNSLRRLEEKFDLDYEKASAKKIDFADLAEVQNRVRKLRRDLSSLGNVNLSAIEEYERLRERHDFLAKQEQDLKEAKTSLEKVIKEIDTIMMKRFVATYNEVGQAFSQVFQELFGGGNAKLELTEPDNFLETGIEIIAQPPGKKLQNLNLLSGGERALTAIALLFAILKVKPSPFCVLDEIEASLDEANVDRFADFLKVFGQKTQFVVISHRQGTIEAADALYGVTMEESGVSKLISVRLTESSEKRAQSA